MNEYAKFARIAQKLHPQNKLLGAWRLRGGVSAQVMALAIEQPDGQTIKLIVRRHGDRDRQYRPHVAAEEYLLLQVLHAEGLATPIPYLLNQSGEIFALPYIVIEFIEGEPEFAPAVIPDFIDQFTTHLVRIHQIAGARQDVSFLQAQEHLFAATLREHSAGFDVAVAAPIYNTLTAAWPFLRQNQPVVLHGDFWPGNMLWKAGQLVGIIDWENALLGDPLADVSRSRLELLWAFGVEAMRDFTQHYQSMTTIDCANLAHWDLYAALQLAAFATWAVDEQAKTIASERYHWFVTQAFARLAAQPQL